MRAHVELIPTPSRATAPAEMCYPAPLGKRSHGLMRIANQPNSLQVLFTLPALLPEAHSERARSRLAHIAVLARHSLRARPLETGALRVDGVAGRKLKHKSARSPPARIALPGSFPDKSL